MEISRKTGAERNPTTDRADQAKAIKGLERYERNRDRAQQMPEHVISCCGSECRVTSGSFQ